LSKFSAVCAAVALCAAALSGESLQSIHDEALRLTALRAIFLRMQVSIDRGVKIDNSWPRKPKAGEQFIPDALADENVYRVIGRATNEAERCASEHVITAKFSNTRQVRFRLYRWPGENSYGLLSVLQYEFLDTSPAMACLSLGPS